jgi:hypothetical protein
MPPKPQIFKTPDGKEFAKKSEWRDYMVATFYSFKDKTDEAEPLIKAPGAVEGQMFTISNCSGTTMALCDHSEQVHVDNLKNCRVMIGACGSSIFIRNCEDCVIYCCSQQLRLRDCIRCKFYVFSMAEVHIEMSSKVEFGPFRGGYPEHKNNLKTANLDTSSNLWYDIYDHNDSLKTKENWSLIDPSQYEDPWFPMGACEPALAATAPGSVDRSAEADSSMSSFTLEQLKVDSVEKPSGTPPAAAPVLPASTAPTTAEAVPVLPPVPATVVEVVTNDVEGVTHVVEVLAAVFPVPDVPPPPHVAQSAAPDELPPTPDAEAVEAVLPPPPAPN